MRRRADGDAWQNGFDVTGGLDEMASESALAALTEVDGDVRQGVGFRAVWRLKRTPSGQSKGDKWQAEKEKRILGLGLGLRLGLMFGPFGLHSLGHFLSKVPLFFFLFFFNIFIQKYTINSYKIK